MNFPNLSDGLGNIKDELTGEFKNLGEEIIEGKTTPADALHEGEEKVMDSLKGFFGSSDEHKEAAEESSEDHNNEESSSDDSADESADADTNTSEEENSDEEEK
jgi:hypothetical protein